MPRSEIAWSYYTPEQLSERDTARGLLAKLLHAQQLVLLLGAGASADLGLPKWSDLVKRSAEQHGETVGYSDITSSADLMKAIDRLRRAHDLTPEGMIATVRAALYGPAAAEDFPRHSFE